MSLYDTHQVKINFLNYCLYADNTLKTYRQMQTQPFNWN